jgi:2-dehydro-3-deoxyphosphogluconate aldolase / (4S)-4-hydroxy-2-oxoglutarate aldolase
LTTITESARQRLQDEQLVAVVRADSPGAAVGAGNALADGGVRALEITFTTPEADVAIAELNRREDVFVGAGTVLDAEQASRAIEAGAKFLVSPGLVPEVLEAGVGAGILAVPGALTPTEVLAARRHAEVIKLFPSSLGGPAYLKALLAPFPDLRLIPTGGIDAGNLGQWLDAGAFALGAGGDLCPPKLIAAGDFEALAAIARRYRAALEAHSGSQA